MGWRPLGELTGAIASLTDGSTAASEVLASDNVARDAIHKVRGTLNAQIAVRKRWGLTAAAGTWGNVGAGYRYGYQKEPRQGTRNPVGAIH